MIVLNYIKFAIFTVLSIQFRYINYLHNSVQQSPLSISHFASSRAEALYLIRNNSYCPSIQSLITAALLAVSINLPNQSVSNKLNHSICVPLFLAYVSRRCLLYISPAPLGCRLCGCDQHLPSLFPSFSVSVFLHLLLSLTCSLPPSTACVSWSWGHGCPPPRARLILEKTGIFSFFHDESGTPGGMRAKAPTSSGLREDAGG